MKKHFLFALFAALIAFTGCKKDKDKQADPDNPGATKLLKRMIETEDGVNTIYDFTYDGNKRLTSFKASDNSERTNFTYDANGNVTKVENIEPDAKFVFEFTYNNGIPVTGSFKSFDMNNGQQGEFLMGYDLQYKVVNGLVTEIKMLMEEGEDELEINHLLTYENGNLKKIQTEGSSAYVVNFTYGNKKPVFPPMFKYILDQAGFSVQFFAKNDILSMQYDHPGTELDFTISNQYTYDANGYILTSNNGETTTKYEYQ